ncbi:MBL fold metallo-hydrolase [Elizabethkingia meningoseptica]|uniref:MBL fold metallo-hydrolase n=1 Tax=Elizabethkingia meningoseptica TaxID=238 RepID=UPI000332C9DD|nr:MBL fold metallo-hydrolase [Elizabethkingia meningoseptica]AQX06227.1 MBL fold metallo-hydrolase [Elizabethkingia meningoseptica]AQX48274.1 MBL fold metallo-hydrolase [Elizabethkingia meningoseptica]EOR29365.1 beta-lactamase [Elizabethkingia meningoseptica ATCC 13253 = NBRC 12535]KUY16359.1 MBL fold metallo-hydrolase [Elizabethkingia meningoseptica]MDE5487768.1 MBL fold metallo-hydrolase [Elizabethkingia meningoseptica]
MKIIPLKDGDFSVDQNKVFIPLSAAGDSPGLKMAIQPFLVITENDYILLDSGLGWQENGSPKIFQNLNLAGITPAQINIILLSHLHKDHIDGLVTQNEDGLSLNFPDARLYIQRREYEFAITKTKSTSYNPDILQFIVTNSEIVWMDEDNGSVTDNVTFEVTGGHTPFHQVFWIKENNETAFYGADNLPQSIYLKYHLAYKSDFDGKKAMQDRIEWEQLAKENSWKILLYHDLSTPVLTL